MSKKKKKKKNQQQQQQRLRYFSEYQTTAHTTCSVFNEQNKTATYF